MRTLLHSTVLLLLAVLSLIDGKFTLSAIFACSAVIISTLARHIDDAFKKTLRHR
jgi:hypothetical protein